MLSFLPATRCFVFKRWLLNLFGFNVGCGAKICGGVRFYGRGNFSVGEDTWVGLGCVFILSEKASINIGDRCDIAPQVLFHTGSHALGDETRRAGKGFSQPIVVGAGSWICSRATLLGGSFIGRGCLVAAGAVVLPGDYKDNSMLAGVPAVLKKKFDFLRSLS